MLNIHFHPFVCRMVACLLDLGDCFKGSPKVASFAKQLTKKRTNKMTKKVFFLCSSGRVHLCLFSGNEC